MRDTPPALIVTPLDAARFATAFTKFLQDEVDACLAVAIAISEIDFDDAQRLISQDERAEAQRFVNDDDRLRFVLGRAALRCLLSRATATKTAHLAFERNEFGKLSVPGSLHFNIAHSGDLIVIGLHKSSEIGVDVEALGRLADWRDLADHYLTEAERALIADAPNEARAAAFLRAWTRKEAVVKAVGRGLSVPLASFAVLPSDRMWHVAATGTGPLADRSLACFDLALDQDHVGAVALASEAPSCTAAKTSFGALLRLALS